MKLIFPVHTDQRKCRKHYLGHPGDQQQELPSLGNAQVVEDVSEADDQNGR